MNSLIKYNNVNGIDMVPGNRHWHSTLSPSGSGIGGGHSQGTVYLPDWGASGAILAIYGIGMGGPGTTDSQYAFDLFDLSSNSWQGEYVLPRSHGPTYSSSKSEVMGILGSGYSGLADVGDEAGSGPHWERHQYHSLEVDNYGYIWTVVGGHYGAASTYGYCYPYMIKSTKPYTDPTWSYSGAGMWRHGETVQEGTAGAYQKIITGKCSCHYNWYFVAGRKSYTTTNWYVWYSPDSGNHWYQGADISDKTALGVSEPYTGINFQYVPEADRTLLFINYLPATVGHGFYWIDCYQMSSNKWGYASDVSPRYYDHTISGSYSGSAFPVSLSDLKSFDKISFGNHPGAMYYDYKLDTFYMVSPASDINWTDKLYLMYKEAGTDANWASSQIISSNRYYLYHAYNKVFMVSGDSNDRYLFTIWLEANSSKEERCNWYAYQKVPFYNGLWTKHLICKSSGASGFAPKHFSVSDDKRIITVGFDIGTTTTW